MPVSSPSYFPPNRANGTVVGISAGQSTTGSRNFLGGKAAGAYTTQSDIIALGDSALSAGTSAVPLSDVNSQYTVIVGSQSGKAITNFTTTAEGGNSTAGPVVLIGGNVLSAAVTMGGTVAIGANIAPLPQNKPGNSGANTIIGINACQNVTSVQNNFENNVVIGYNAYRCNSSGAQDLTTSVIIGAHTLELGGAQGFGTVAANVIIGYFAARSLGGQSQRNVVVGQGAGSSITTSIVDCTLIGNAADAGASVNTVIGSASSAGTSNNCLLLGDNISAGGTNISGSIAIGSGASPPTATTDIFVVETFRVATKRTMLYGDLSAGNLIVGNSTSGTNRDFGGVGATNIVKFLNGVKGASNPAGGGYFYVTGGALHWVGSSGTDTTLAPA